MKLFMTNSDEVFPGLRDTDISDVNVMECIQRNDGVFNAFYGKKHTEESRKACASYGFLGKKHSEESKKMMANKTAGVENGFYGKKHTEESKQKMKDNHKGTTGMTFTEEHRKKLSEKGKLGWIKRRLTV